MYFTYSTDMLESHLFNKTILMKLGDNLYVQQLYINDQTFYLTVQ